MTSKVLVSPRATARLVVTMPPQPSRLANALAADMASDYVALTRTTDAFRHLAALARARFTIMIPFVDSVGAAWAAELFEATGATERLLVLRDVSQLTVCGASGRRVEAAASRIIDYGGADLTKETFHAKIVLADGIAAYVGSANLLRRSKRLCQNGSATVDDRVLCDSGRLRDRTRKARCGTRPPVRSIAARVYAMEAI